MDRSPADPGEETPAGVYRRRLQQLGQAQSVEQRRERLLGLAKLAVAVITVVSAIWLLHRTAAIELLLLPVAVFIALAILHDRLIRSVNLRARAIRFYERGHARLEDRWAGTGETGERFLDPLHPYARDLDLFGRGSLFELLCTARTRAGEETLAAWLLAAAPVEEILPRHQAIRELEPRVIFREKLFTLGETVRLGAHPEALAAWGERKPIFPARSTRMATTAVALLCLSSFVLWAVWGWVYAVVAAFLLSRAWARHLNRRMDQAADAIEAAADDLKLLAQVLALMEHEPFSAPRLAQLQSALKRGAVPPSVAIRRLARIAARIEQRRNMMARVLDVFTFWTAHQVFAAERWQREFGPQIRGWLRAVGELEALTALSGYAYEHPGDVLPEFAGDGPLFDAEGLAHPLMPAATAVRNTLKLGDRLQLMLLSGPNMAGKSTLIRAVGVNAVLALCGAPVRAARLRLSPLAVAASICVLDSLSGGISRFYAEIHRIKLAVGLTRGPVPVLFLLDELLSGTNSNDRLAGTKLVVESLTARGAIGIVSTHDLALTRVPEEMGGRAVNCHFADRFEDGKLIFDYKLRPGVATTSNALELMRSIGLGPTS